MYGILFIGYLAKELMCYVNFVPGMSTHTTGQHLCDGLYLM
jgi:hypothetical protein